MSSSASKSPLDFSDWKLEDDLREAQRLVRLIQLQCDEPESIAMSDDEPSLADDASDAHPLPRRAARSASAGGSGSSLLAWLLLGCGLSGLVCGCALLVWSHVTGRGDLWNIGLPVALVSQAVLASGLVLQHDFRGQRSAESDGDYTAPPVAATHLHVNTGSAMHASGLSVHFSTTAQPQAAPSSRDIKRQVEAALKRRAA